LPPSGAMQNVQLDNGRVIEVPASVAMGAEARYEDWVYLIMLEREWTRPILEADKFLDVSEPSRPTARAATLILFWSYFETRIDRLLQEAMSKLAPGIREDLLRRYASISARLERLYKILFGTTYWGDLEDLGFPHIASLLQRVQQRRNNFVHGDPAAIDYQIVAELIESLRDEHEAWIAVFNRRAAHPPAVS
jgi:hypothetical protein